MRISDWSSDVCSSDLGRAAACASDRDIGEAAFLLEAREAAFVERALRGEDAFFPAGEEDGAEFQALGGVDRHDRDLGLVGGRVVIHHQADVFEERSEEHTSELQSLMRISYAVFCLTQKK